MPQIVFQPGLCSDVAATPQVVGCDGAAFVEWEVLEKPTGSSVAFSDTTIAEPSIDVSQDGTYKLQLCCTFESGVSDADTTPPAQALNCPRGVIAGDTATIVLTGCQNGIIENLVVGGSATGVTFDSSGVGTVTTDVDSSGGASVSVDCTTFDDQGNPSTQTFNCLFNVWPSDLEIVETTAPAATFTYIECGQSCFCDPVTVVFDCGQQKDCSEVQFNVVFKDCPPCPPDEECEAIEFQPILGSPLVVNDCVDFIECCDDEIRCCDPDRPALFWNNLCTCPGWTIDAPAINGTSIYNTCSCNSGQKWCFEGSATITASGPAQLVDTVIIWGHDIISGTVTTDPLKGFSSNIFSINPVRDGACMEGYSIPLVINFAGTEEDPLLPVTDLSITIESADGGPVCIDRIFIGQKLFFPNDLLPASFQNPHDGTDVSLDIKENDCGIISQSLKHDPIDLDIDIECVTDRWLKEVWRPYIRYAQRHGVYFQWSRNNCPTDLFCGWIPDKIGPSTWESDDSSNVTLSTRGFITQPQHRRLV